MSWFGSPPLTPEQARSEMIQNQLIARGLRHPRVLGALAEVPRHLFVPEADVRRAYGDHALPIGNGQTISQPFIVARMTEELDPQPTHRVLDVGTGSGYQAAVLSRLAERVVSIERVPALADRARALLASLGYDNVLVVVGDGTLGYRPEAPYDGIVVAAGAPTVPRALEAQLADGGRIVIPVGDRVGQVLWVIERVGGRFERRVTDPCVFVPLIGEEGWPG